MNIIYGCVITNKKRNEKIETYVCNDFDETFGVNDESSIILCENIYEMRINNEHMLKGLH